MSHDKQKNKWQKIAEQEDALSVSEVTDAVEGSDFTSEIETLSDKKLADHVKLLEKEVQDHKDQAVRARAELENVRRRLERDVANAHKYGTERLISELLPIIDSLVRALEGVATEDAQMEMVRQGLEITLDMFHKSLEKHGVTIISPAKGEAFDPTKHEAVTIQPNSEVQPNTVLQVLQKGYMLNGRVIRAAMLIVAS